jgi:hypothetical protein
VTNSVIELLITLLQDDQPRSLVCWVPQVGAIYILM